MRKLREITTEMLFSVGFEDCGVDERQKILRRLEIKRNRLFVIWVSLIKPL